MNAITITAPADLMTEIALAEHAAVIRALGKRAISDIAEIGRRLNDAKDNHTKHGQWLPWLDREFGWTEQTALHFMRIDGVVAKSKKFLDLDIPVSGLYLLAAPSTAEEARTEVLSRSEDGEKLSLADVQRIVDEATFKQHDKLVAEMAVKAKIAEDAIRAEYDGKLVVDPEKLQADINKAVDKALKPWQRDLKAAEKKLASAQKRLEEQEAAADPTPKGPKIDSNISLASTGVQMAVRMLASKLTITAQQMVEIEKLSATATGQTPVDRLGVTRNEAAVIIAWLTDFCAFNLEETP
jgi:Protein of unknown function (DUF3102)